MTNTQTEEMNGEALGGGKRVSPSRPPLASQLSNSMPSTPQQHACAFFSRSRTPSPARNVKNYSPRSVYSESGLPTPQPAKAFCKYERALTGRRRMGYNIGADPLEPEQPPPAQELENDVEAKLTTDMRELYGRLQPSRESQDNRKKLVAKIQRLLEDQWPGNEFVIHVFGSSGNLLCTTDSDGMATSHVTVSKRTLTVQSTYASRRR